MICIPCGQPHPPAVPLSQPQVVSLSLPSSVHCLCIMTVSHLQARRVLLGKCLMLLLLLLLPLQSKGLTEGQEIQPEMCKRPQIFQIKEATIYHNVKLHC